MTTRTNIPSTMEAGRLHGVDDFRVEEIPTPEPGLREVLCRVEAVTICGTDIAIIKGHHQQWAKDLPLTLGHEWAGRVVALGEGSEGFGFHLGDPVCGTSHSGCGFCRMCLIGRYNLCVNYGHPELGHRQYGHVTDGAYAEYMVNTLKTIHKIPEDMPFEIAANVDPAAIGLHSVKRTGIHPGETVVVLGPGPVGFFAFQCAFALGAGRVIMVGSGERLAKAAEMGAETVNYRETDPVQAVRDLTGGWGADVVVDCAATKDSLVQAIDMTCKGGRVAYTGIPTEAPVLNYRKLILEEVDVYGVRANPNAAVETIPLFQRGAIRAEPLITHRFPLKEYREAYDTFVERRDGAILVSLRPGAEGTGETAGTA